MRRADRDDTSLDSCHEDEKHGDDDARAALQAAGRPDADQMTHHEPEIEATRMDQQPFEDVGVTAQMRAAHAAGVVDMCERAFNPVPRQYRVRAKISLTFARLLSILHTMHH